MTKTISVSMSLTPPLVQRIDRQRKALSHKFGGWLSRSAVIRCAVAEWLDTVESEGDVENHRDHVPARRSSRAAVTGGAQ
jgi:Arc/MetJ-type ribon-helix-helix transcriptional regulator